MRLPIRVGGLRVLLAAAAISVCGAQSARAGVITFVQWSPVPSNSLPEMVYNSVTGLQTGAGAISNGDGNQPLAVQTPGGLETDTIDNAPLPPFSFNSSVITGGTGYYDTTLTFTSGMAPAGAAQQFGALDIQALTPGTFMLTSSTATGSVLLLSGTISGANLITGVDNSTSAAQLDGNGVTYTGGLLVANAPAGSVMGGNSMSISMTAVTPPLGESGGVLNSFTADATGQFDITVAPEPATLGLILPGLIMLKRRRK